MAANPATQTLQEQLDAFLVHVQRETGVPGIGAAVSLQGKRIHSSVGVLAQGGDQPVTKDTQFHLGCITKLFVSIVALELAWAKKLDLTTPIGSYLPELADTVHGTTVNIGHLLSHTSGYRGTSILERETFGWCWDNLIGYLRSAPQHFTPGTVFNYEHSEAVIAGEIVRRLTGKTAVEHIKGRLLEPRGVAVGTLDAGRHDQQLQAGQHLLDPATRKFKQVYFADLVEPGKKPSTMWESAFSRYSVSLDSLLGIAEYLMGQASRLVDDNSMISAATLSLLQRPAIRLPTMISGPLSEVLPVTFGLGAAHWRDGFYGVGGSTYGQCQGFRFDARVGAAVAVGVNVLQPYLRDLVIGRICECLGSSHRDEQPQAITEFELGELVGEYRGPGSSRVVATLDDERLDLVIEMSGIQWKTAAEIVKDADRGLILGSAAPFLSVGFFRESDNDNIGMMVGVNAYKRVSASA